MSSERAIRTPRSYVPCDRTRPPFPTLTDEPGLPNSNKSSSVDFGGGRAFTGCRETPIPLFRDVSSKSRAARTGGPQNTPARARRGPGRVRETTGSATTGPSPVRPPATENGDPRRESPSQRLIPRFSWVEPRGVEPLTSGMQISRKRIAYLRQPGRAANHLRKLAPAYTALSPALPLSSVLNVYRNRGRPTRSSHLVGRAAGPV
jgi:hypothetical protein